MDLNQAEVAVTTQHLIDMGQEKTTCCKCPTSATWGNSCAPAPNCSPKRKLRNTGTRNGRKSRTCSSTNLKGEDQGPTFEIRKGGPRGVASSTGVTVTGMTSVRKTRTCWWRTISNFMEMRPISTMSLARTAGMTACCTIRAYQATISTRVFPRFEVFDDNYD